MKKGAFAFLADVTLGATVVVGCGSSRSVAATIEAAGCTYPDIAPFPPNDAATNANYHNDFPTLTTKPHWSTFPPAVKKDTDPV